MCLLLSLNYVLNLQIDVSHTQTLLQLPRSGNRKTVRQQLGTEKTTGNKYLYSLPVVGSCSTVVKTNIT